MKKNKHLTDEACLSGRQVREFVGDWPPSHQAKRETMEQDIKRVINKIDKGFVICGVVKGEEIKTNICGELDWKNMLVATFSMLIKVVQEKILEENGNKSCPDCSYEARNGHSLECPKYKEVI